MKEIFSKVDSCGTLAPWHKSFTVDWERPQARANAISVLYSEALMHREMDSASVDFLGGMVGVETVASNLYVCSLTQPCQSNSFAETSLNGNLSSADSPNHA
jgi:hypothetical protein